MNKLHQNEKGFAHLALIAGVIIVLGVIGFAVTRVMNNKNNTDGKQNNSTQEQTNQNSSETEPDLKLHNFGLASLDDVLITKDALREYSEGHKGFYVFGDKLPDGKRQNPNFEMASLKEGTQVVASIDGVVAFIKEQTETSDYEVFLQPKENSIWTIGYDHLINLKVKKGDTVKVGDVLGNPQRENNGALRFEIQINKGQNDQTKHICPTTLLADNVKDKVQTELKTMLDSWETKTGYELYDIDAQKPIGCIKTILTPAEAEGR